MMAGVGDGRDAFGGCDESRPDDMTRARDIAPVQ